MKTTILEYTIEDVSGEFKSGIRLSPISEIKLHIQDVLFVKFGKLIKVLEIDLNIYSRILVVCRIYNKR